MKYEVGSQKVGKNFAFVELSYRLSDFILLTSDFILPTETHASPAFPQAVVKKYLHISKNTLPLRAIKFPLMKKLIAILVVAGAMAACNNSTDSAASSVDSAAKAATDSVKATVDTTVKKIDSTAKAAIDTAKAKVSAVADSAKKAIKK